MSALPDPSALQPDLSAESPDSDSIKLDTLVNRAGLRYPQFRRTLTPRRAASVRSWRKRPPVASSAQI